MEGQFYEDIAYGSLVGIYRRRAKAVDLSVSKIKETIKKPFCDNWEQYRDFQEVEVSLKSVPLKYKQQILNFWQSKKFDNVLVIPFSGKEVLDLLKKHCKDRLELINKYSEEIKNNVKLVVCAEFYSSDFDYDNHYGCLTFAVSKSGCINEINDILTNNGETFSISREKFLNLFECGFSSGKASFNLECKEEAKKKE